MDCSPPGSSVQGIFPGKNTGVGVDPFARGSSQPRDRTRVSHISGRFFYCLSHQGSQAEVNFKGPPASSGPSLQAHFPTPRHISGPDTGLLGAPGTLPTAFMRCFLCQERPLVLQCPSDGTGHGATLIFTSF